MVINHFSFYASVEDADNSVTSCKMFQYILLDGSFSGKQKLLSLV